MSGSHSRQLAVGFAAFSALFMATKLMTSAGAQTVQPAILQDSAKGDMPGRKKSPDVPAVVEVQPAAHDEEIVERLDKILKATGWFESAEVRVDEGVVFLSGQTDQEQYKVWAGNLAQNTRDVVAVVNKIDVSGPSPWNFQPALVGLQELGHGVNYWIPYTLLAVVILLMTCGMAVVVTRGVRSVLTPHVRVPLLQKVISRTVGLLVLLVGLYLVLRICGLTRLAVTVVGGTGLIGLIIGIAFRDITENFLASILLSVQAPFRVGDLIELAGVSGLVQQLNVRTTVLMSLSGQHIQLPNSMVYKSTIRNYSSNPNRREEFTVGIGYDVPIIRAQELALKLLDEHPAILKTPEPWVLVDSLGPATVNLRIYFWLDGSQFSWLKVRSSAIRLIKRSFQEQNITMPDEVREVIFPNGVQVQMMPNSQPPSPMDEPKPSPPPKAPTEQISIEAEGGLGTDAREIEEQASHSRTPETGQNLLRFSDAK